MPGTVTPDPLLMATSAILHRFQSHLGLEQHTREQQLAFSSDSSTGLPHTQGSQWHGAPDVARPYRQRPSRLAPYYAPNRVTAELDESSAWQAVFQTVSESRTSMDSITPDLVSDSEFPQLFEHDVDKSEAEHDADLDVLDDELVLDLKPRRIGVIRVRFGSVTRAVPKFSFDEDDIEE